jgi:hypothetical protein
MSTSSVHIWGCDVTETTDDIAARLEQAVARLALSEEPSGFAALLEEAADE